MALLDVKELSVEYRGIPLVSEVSFRIQRGEWFSLVGESGSGKSVTSSAIGGLLPGGLRVAGGEIRLQEQDMRSVSACQLRKMRGKNLSYVFQDYQNAFTPFIRIGKQLDEMVQRHESLQRDERRRLILESLTEVGLDAERVYSSYPFQLSGGQLQRTAIAQAIVLRPSLLIADEPTTALDAVTSASVLKLLNDIKQKMQCAILFITHDLRCVRRYADTVAIMNTGRIVESGYKTEILGNPRHPYTRELFAAVPPLRNVPRRLAVKSFCEYLEAEGG
ncbi:MAG TPA: ABC transporter ATP-binding protein [Patescibacteria group bacterium]|nr:ABC transporter ATP-binding protein [Patescibacteria group bacterium]